MVLHNIINLCRMKLISEFCRMVRVLICGTCCDYSCLRKYLSTLSYGNKVKRLCQSMKTMSGAPPPSVEIILFVFSYK